MNDIKPKAVFLFDNIGPYHAARLSAVREFLSAVAVQFGSASANYAWAAKIPNNISVKTINPDGLGSDLNYFEFNKRLVQALEAERPEVLFVNGWGFKGALMAIKWAKKNNIRIVLMSETRRVDGVRSSVGEWVKRRIVSICDAGFCGSKSHRRYLEELGLPKERVALGYNAVDNQFFSKTQYGKEFSVFSFQFSECDSENPQTQRPYFLASNRFVERKNLKRLVEAYARYAVSFNKSDKIFPLLLLGNGKQRLELMKHCNELGLAVVNFENTDGLKLKIPARGGCVVFAGFRQVEELPFFYGGAVAFIHPALSEPWGLVINEAMASGLPILSSKNVGAAEELVRDGINGFLFDPENVEELAGLLVRVAEMRQEDREAMGKSSRRLVAEWGPERFAQGAQKAARAAMSAPIKYAGILDRMLLEILIRN